MPLLSLQLSYATKYMKTLGQISQDFKKNKNVTDKHHSTFSNMKVGYIFFLWNNKGGKKGGKFSHYPVR